MEILGDRCRIKLEEKILAGIFGKIFLKNNKSKTTKINKFLNEKSM